MIKSFRLRLALLSALLTGLALIAFGLGSWWLIRGLKIDRIDSEIRQHAERQVGRALDAVNWQNTESRIAGGLGISDSSSFLMLVQDADGETIHRSARWPANLDPARLPWPKQRPAAAGAGSSYWPTLVGEAQAAEPPLQLAQARRGPGGPGGPGPLGAPGGAAPGGPEGGQGAPERPPAGESFPRRPPPRDDLPPAAGRRQGDAPEGRRSEFSDGRRRELPVWRADPPAVTPLVPLPAVAPPVTRPPVVDKAADEPVPATPPPPPPETVREAAERIVRPPGERLPPPLSALHTEALEGRLWHIGLASTAHARVAVAVDARILDEDMKGIRNAFLLALPFALALIGIAGWVFSGRALKPIEKLAAATRKVTAAGLDQRISARGEDKEFVELIAVFNRMLERLERSFGQAHRFSADAAHELKTPLAILQGQLERAINSTEDGSPMQAQLTSILDEVRRLSTISRKLLLLSQADAGRLAVHRQPFDLSQVLDELIEDTRMLAPQLQVSGDIRPGIVVDADGSLLTQVLHNLISNAIKYNVDKGWIHISTNVWPTLIEVVVANASPGIPAGERSKIFERFYRADPAHSRNIEGVGLGLSVSREIARAHGGDIALKTGDDASVQFSLTLPAAGTCQTITASPAEPEDLPLLLESTARH